MTKHLKSLLSPIMMAVVLMAPQMIQAMEDKGEKAVVLFPNSNLTLDVGKFILEIAVKDSCYEFGLAGNIGFVCKAWDKFVNEKQYISPLYKDLKISLETKFLHDTFYNGELVYRPDTKRDEGMIRLKISDLVNPLDGTFDLSKCGDTAKYLSISTGYRKGIIKENENKVEICFASREYIKKELAEGRAQQFKGIFLTWKPNASIGIFWSWANVDNLNWFDHLTGADNLTLCSKNLYENWCAAQSVERTACARRWGGRVVPMNRKFHVHFK